MMSLPQCFLGTRTCIISSVTMAQSLLPLIITMTLWLAYIQVDILREIIEHYSVSSMLPSLYYSPSVETFWIGTINRQILC